MDELIRTFQLGESVTPVVTVWTLILGTLLSAALSMGVALVYRQIHSETTYSQTFVHTMVLLCVIVCFIMISHRKQHRASLLAGGSAVDHPLPYCHTLSARRRLPVLHDGDQHGLGP
ncbi:MAG: hypothetical protein O7F16_12740 [Acidobacteria bacterium]|nr:hypothetical protein [Acidobacteriota bacterium]